MKRKKYGMDSIHKISSDICEKIRKFLLSNAFTLAGERA